MFRMHRNGAILRGLALALACVSGCIAQSAQTAQKYWLAGRYDSSHVVVVFGGVQGVKTPTGAVGAPAPDAGELGFLGGMVFIPAEGAGAYLAQIGGDRFAPGDTYELLPGSGYLPLRITLEKYVAWSFDSGGFFGALAKVEPEGGDAYPVAMFTPDLYLVQRTPAAAPPRRPARLPPQARLANTPGAVPVFARIARALGADLPPPADWHAPCMYKVPQQAVWAWIRAHPDETREEVKTVVMPDGSPRYFVRAEWHLPAILLAGSGRDARGGFALSAWVSPKPSMHVVQWLPDYGTCLFGLAEQPKIENVIGIAGGQTAVILLRPTLDGYGVVVEAYRDGAAMPVLISWATSE